MLFVEGSKQGFGWDGLDGFGLLDWVGGLKEQKFAHFSFDVFATDVGEGGPEVRDYIFAARDVGPVHLLVLLDVRGQFYLRVGQHEFEIRVVVHLGPFLDDVVGL